MQKQMHKHEKLIAALGGPIPLHQIMVVNSPQVVDRWRYHGIPIKYWPTIARLCEERKIKVPKDIRDFLK